MSNKTRILLFNSIFRSEFNDGLISSPVCIVYTLLPIATRNFWGLNQGKLSTERHTSGHLTIIIQVDISKKIETVSNHLLL